MNTHNLPDDIDPVDNPNAERKREEAFAAAPFHWKDIALHPLSIGREGDWLQHCTRIGLPTLSAVINSGEGFLAHAQRLLWFCAHEPIAWLSRWMRGGEAAPILIEVLINEWAEKHIRPGDQVAVLKTALDIYDRAHLTDPQRIDDEEEDPEGNAPGPRDVLSTSASSQGPAPASVPSTTSNTRSPRRKAGPSSTPTARPKAPATNGPKRSRKKKPSSARG